MKNLKKFQGFALTQDEQKNVTGGKLAHWTCVIEGAGGAWYSSYAGTTSGEAVSMCNRYGSRCIGCSN